MREKLITLTVFCFLLLYGCEEYEYTIQMKPDDDLIVRKIVCSENTPESVRNKLKKLYDKQIDKNTYEGSFRENLPEDIGGFGRYVHLSNPMGDVHIYVERFRGDDTQALDLEKAFDAIDYLADLIIDWLEFELGDNPNFDRLKSFCNEELREDVKNLIVYMWMGNRVYDIPEEDAVVRMLLYLYERDYFTLDDISSIVASTNQEAWIQSYLQRLISRQLGYSNAGEVIEELEFLKDKNGVQQSISRFLKSPQMYDKVLQEARVISGDPNLIIDPNWIVDPNNIQDLLLENHGVELETFFIDFGLIGSSPDKVNIKLDCPRKPFETNGEWDKDTKQLRWSNKIKPGQLPFVYYATIGNPNDAFQKRYFDRVILMDEQLLPYAFWYEGLNNEQQREWDEFLATLDPNEVVNKKVESFRFKDAPPPSPDSDGVVKLLSDLPRNLILEGLKMNKKDYQESDSQEPAQAQQQSFTVHPIGKVVKKEGRTFIELDKKYEAGLKGLEKHSYVHVVYWFDRNDTPEKRAILQVNPRGDKNNPLTGVFATHSPFRPNLTAISRCDIISIKENVIEIKEIDAFDGSPVLDLKGDFFRFYKPNTK